MGPPTVYDNGGYYGAGAGSTVPSTGGYDGLLDPDGLVAGYVSYLNTSKYTGNNLTPAQQAYNNEIDKLLAELNELQTSTGRQFSIGYVRINDKIVYNSGSAVADAGFFSGNARIYKEYGENVTPNYASMAHELHHLFQLKNGNLDNYTRDDEYEAYQIQYMIKRKEEYFRDAQWQNAAYNDALNPMYGNMQWEWQQGFQTGNDSSGGEGGGYGSSGLISTGFDNDVYWENYYVYEENGPYTPGDGPLQNAILNYSTGYNYSTGSSTGSESSTGN